jgi:hypothetical protein
LRRPDYYFNLTCSRIFFLGTVPPSTLIAACLGHRENCDFVVIVGDTCVGKGVRRATGGPVVRVRLTRKLAAKMQGVDVSKRKVGDVIELPDEQATLMVQAGWAERVGETERKKLVRAKKSKN